MLKFCYGIVEIEGSPENVQKIFADVLPDGFLLRQFLGLIVTEYGAFTYIHTQHILGKLFIFRGSFFVDLE
jgi:hypothetical protein